jgi:hypothetical protein
MSRIRRGPKKSPEVLAFLLHLFQLGVDTPGKRVSPLSATIAMRDALSNDDLTCNLPKFLPHELLSPAQIKSHFSTLASERKKQSVSKSKSKSGNKKRGSAEDNSDAENSDEEADDPMDEA